MLKLAVMFSHSGVALLEPQHDTVDRLLGIDDDPLAILVRNDMSNLVRALVNDGRADIRLVVELAFKSP